jgi:hypothetical protein
LPLPLPRPPDRAPGTAVASPLDPTSIGLDGMPLDASPTSDLEPVLHFPDLEAELADLLPQPPDDLSTLEGLERALIEADDRDALARALIGFCAGRVRRAALFAVGKDSIRGVHAAGEAFDGGTVRAVSVPRGGATVLDTALASRDFYFGVVPSLPANADLYTALGGRMPTSVLVLPIRVKDRTAALLYLDEGDRPMTRPEIPLMRRVAAKAGLALELLLLRTKLRSI